MYPSKIHTNFVGVHNKTPCGNVNMQGKILKDVDSHLANFEYVYVNEDEDYLYACNDIKKFKTITFDTEVLKFFNILCYFLVPFK